MRDTSSGYPRRSTNAIEFLTLESIFDEASFRKRLTHAANVLRGKFATSSYPDLFDVQEAGTFWNEVSTLFDPDADMKPGDDHGCFR